MKEVYLTVTRLSFVLEGRVLGRGQVITSSSAPLPPGALWEESETQPPRMGTLLSHGDGTGTASRWEASLEGEPGYLLTVAAGRFALAKKAPEAAARDSRQAL
jgi:hypothetical protein